MSLINQALLFGLGFAAIPLILHLLMRAKPKKLMFPALRLIEMRRKTNSRRVRLRHIWLLLLRTLVFGLLVVAIARPSLPAANYGLNTRELITLGLIVAAAAGVYYWLLRRWRRERMPVHMLRYRRTMLRGGTGGAVALLTLLLVVWPYGSRIAAEVSGEAPEVARDLPVAAVFLFDTSPSMEYRYESRTRLKEGQAIALSHLSGLPSGSRVAIADTASDQDIVFQADLISARARIESIAPHASSLDLNDRLARALVLHEDDRSRLQEARGLEQGGDADEFVREVYIFTDSARTAWRLGTTTLKRRLEELPWVHTYIIDLSVSQPLNCGITGLRLSRQSLTAGGRLTVDATLVATGDKASSQTAEIYVRDKAGEALKQGQTTVQLSGGTGARVTFPLQARSGPLLQGEIRLKSGDPMVNDDVRYFSVGVAPPPRVLLVGESRLESSYLQNALAPREFVRQNRAAHDVTYQSIRSFDARRLSDFDVVCLINLREPQPEHWEALSKFVREGGGLAVFLGRRKISAEAYNTPEAQAVLPARLLTPVRFFKGPFVIDLNRNEHPLFRYFSQSNDLSAAFSAVEYKQAWMVEPVENAFVIASYNNDRESPAWVERVTGKGRALLFSNAPDSVAGGGREWSDLHNGWTFVALAAQLVQHLSDQTASVFNWLCGQNPIVRFDRAAVQERYLLRKPGLQQLPGSIPPDGDVVIIEEADQVGHYAFLSGSIEGGFRTGFSMNSDDRESDFTTITDAQLTELLGPDRFSRARQIEELDRAVQSSRLGREVYPLLMILVVILFCSEHLVANHFYDAESTGAESAVGDRGPAVPA